ncbi:Rieske (2Fe-2S) protein [Streptomyces sp. SL13]|uniref:Cytochrome bc1 complex Rieske iron-sulfur subunit n=1 Tax=Streptantibioticus silvisoli TaxID=2705255 RepID=A0AA90HCF1_9ACTN|nr:Rieske (2Fe-2S) protein [Streptantibioticus silvisoli]MDI5973160.1 Rieske (2Fe-2S) protein [Streptantibioticus silvisoli]
MTDAQPAADHARRSVLQGAALAGVAGLGVTALSGCAAKPAKPAGPVHLGSTDQVPVGGAALFRDDKVVVAQPAKGHFTAFSAVCTHQGCVVASIAHGVISCPCHGSEFNALTGAVVQGPATRALPAVSLKVEDGKMIAGS